MEVENREVGEHSLAEVAKMLDLVEFERSYEGLGWAAKNYRDAVVRKLFSVIAGKNGDIEAVKHRWFDLSDYFKTYRLKRDEKAKGFCEIIKCHFNPHLCSAKSRKGKIKVVREEEWHMVHANQVEQEKLYNNEVAKVVISTFRPSCQFSSFSFFIYSLFFQIIC
jgi:hypothetical protein